MRVLPVLAVLVSLLAMTTSAEAAGFGCSSSALRASVLGQTIEPVVANSGLQGCQTDSAALTSALPAPLSSTAVAAFTSLTGTGLDQKATSGAGVGGLRLQALPSLPISLDQITAPLTGTLNGATVPLAAIPLDLGAVGTVVTSGLSALGLPTAITVDATHAVASLVPAPRALAPTDLLDIGSAMAYAGAACQAGKALLSAAPALSNVSIAGQAVDATRPVAQTIPVVPGQTVNFANADPADYVLSSNVATLLGSSSLNPLVVAAKAALAPLTTAAAVKSLIAPVLAGLPVVTVPALDAKVALAPGGSTRTADSITQQALAVTASVGPLKLIDAIVGEATASAAGVDCSLPLPPLPAVTPGTTVAPTPQAATLQCNTRRLVLVDVLQRAGRVILNGVADPKLAGQTVGIVFNATGQTVAHAVVGKTGSFATTAPLPVRSLRYSNAARYTAVVGQEQSKDLKLHRRLVLGRMTQSGSRIVMTGRVVGPLTKPAAPIVLTRRISCSTNEVVGRFKPHRDGTFRIVIRAPKGPGAAVYRMTTTVLHSGGRGRFKTFTLPRAVELRG